MQTAKEESRTLAPVPNDASGSEYKQDKKCRLVRIQWINVVAESPCSDQIIDPLQGEGQVTYRWQFGRIFHLDHGICQCRVLLAFSWDLHSKLRFLDAIGRAEDRRRVSLGCSDGNGGDRGRGNDGCRDSGHGSVFRMNG